MSQYVNDECENAYITIQKHRGAKQEHGIICTSETTDNITFIATTFKKK